MDQTFLSSTCSKIDLRSMQFGGQVNTLNFLKSFLSKELCYPAEKEATVSLRELVKSSMKGCTWSGIMFSAKVTST